MDKLIYQIGWWFCIILSILLFCNSLMIGSDVCEPTSSTQGYATTCSIYQASLYIPIFMVGLSIFILIYIRYCGIQDKIAFTQREEVYINCIKVLRKQLKKGGRNSSQD